MVCIYIDCCTIGIGTRIKEEILHIMELQKMEDQFYKQTKRVKYVNCAMLCSEAYQTKWHKCN